MTTNLAKTISVLLHVVVIVPTSMAAIESKFSFCALATDGSIIADSGAKEVSVDNGADDMFSYKYDEHKIIAYSYEVCFMFEVQTSETLPMLLA